MRVDLDESKSKRTCHAQANDCPAGFDDGRVGEGTAGIPDQVAHAVHAVVCEGESQGGLEKNLGGNGEGTHGSDHGSRLQVPADDGGGEVCGRPQVKSAGEGDASDTVQGTTDPANLRLVDTEMRSNRAV